MAEPRGEPKNEPPFTRPRTAPPPPPPARPSLLAGKGLFTTWDAEAAVDLDADWVALQADPEGGPIDAEEFAPANVLAWEARALRGWDAVRELGGIGYIGQAENPDEFRACMALGSIAGPHWLVGKPDGWGSTDEEIAEAMAEAHARDWGLLIEWYWNTQPELVHGPDSRGYPVDSCLFGSWAVNGVYVAIPDYRAVWHGPFGCYAAETMSIADRRAFPLIRT